MIMIAKAMPGRGSAVRKVGLLLGRMRVLGTILVVLYASGIILSFQWDQAGHFILAAVNVFGVWTSIYVAEFWLKRKPQWEADRRRFFRLGMVGAAAFASVGVAHFMLALFSAHEEWLDFPLWPEASMMAILLMLVLIWAKPPKHG